MYIVYNNIEDKIVFEGNGKEFINFMLLILEENLDSNNFTIENIQHCIYYINTFCDNLEIVE
jgi:hypothetical protein